jgi:hypothetical protein
MKKVSIWIATALVLAGGLPAAKAQQLVERQGFAKKAALIEFAQKSHDFGQVPEQEGPVTHTFEFANTGEVPIRILGVKASCGCTTPDWSKEEIAPDEKGFVVAQYDPSNRPGVFNKTLTVNTSAEPNIVMLTIKGTVKPRPRTAIDDFPTEMGNLRVKYRGFNMGKVTSEAPVTKSFEVYNQGDQPLLFSDKVIAPDYLTVSFKPQEIPANSRGEIVLTYDVPARNELGWVSDNLVLFTNEAEGENMKSFSVMATIEEYFPPMTGEELALAPRLELDKTLYDFGSIKEGKLVETEFLITNSGQQELSIRKTKANCGCTVSKPEKEVLQPGESSKILVSFDTKGRKGNQYKTVTIFSNDPTAPTQTVTIKGEVKE